MVIIQGICVILFFYFSYLKGNYVCRCVDDFFQDDVFPIVPAEGPAGAIAISCGGDIIVTEDII